ncbi:hypothetical protein IT399_00800 [Candidatus Nomurabacteria bacterium]|nr:hypothetical protein [Candidatus Nomurabacteria bacterium]
MQEENILMQAGLSEEQSLVYQALLDKGPQRASDLSKWTGIKRGLIYKVLEQLESMGLVSKNGGIGTVATFSPAHPSLLLSNIERKEKEIALNKEILLSSIGSLSSKYNLILGKPNVQFFEGEDGIKKVLADTLTSKTEIYAYSDIEAIFKYIPEINKEYVAKREKLKLKKKGIFIDTPEARQLLTDYHSEITENKFMKQDALSFESIMQIYDDKISYITLSPNKMIGVIIEDPIIYRMHKYIYEFLWSQI